MNSHLRAIADTALPSLRVIGMAYTGLIAVGAMALVVLVAFLPVTPVLQQATEPAREAVVNFIQPATDAVTSLVAARTVTPEPIGPFVPALQTALASAQVTDEVIPEDAPVASAAIVDNLPVAVAALRPQSAPPVALAKVAVTRSVDGRDTDAVAADDAALDEPVQAVDPPARAPVQQVVEVVAESPVQQVANAEPPRSLPPVPTPPETAVQTKARLDLENQAAIDAAKASGVRRKAEADAANQAAIDARKGATAKVPTHGTQAVATPLAQPAPSTPVPSAPPAPSPPATTPVTVTEAVTTSGVQKQTVRQTPSNPVVDDQSQQDEAPMMLALDAP